METPPTTATAAAQLVHELAVAEMQQFRVFLRLATTATPMLAVAVMLTVVRPEVYLCAAMVPFAQNSSFVMMEIRKAAMDVTGIVLERITSVVTQS